MLKEIGSSVVISIAVFGLSNCSSENQNIKTNSASPAINSQPKANTANTVSKAPDNSENTIANNADNSNSKTVRLSNVTRISFAKDASSGTARVNLPPNEAKQFAVDGNYGQKIKVTADSKDAIVKMISGTDRLVESPGGGLVVSINVSGDVIFEVRNATDKELNTTIRAEITNAY